MAVRFRTGAGCPKSRNREECKCFSIFFGREFYRGKLLEELSKDSAKGKSISDIFTGLMTGEDGKPKADIFVNREQESLEQNRARFTQPLNGGKPSGIKVTPTELMKMKNENPNLDISQYM